MQAHALRPLIPILFATLTFAQNDSIFRTTTKLVRIDVAAQDKSGKPVTDLGKDDFELKVSGKPQAIETFTVTSTEPVAPVTLPWGTFSNKQEATEVAQGRYTVFLLDWRNTNEQLQSWAHDELRKMLAATPPGGKVALYLINNGFQIVQEFTSDRELLRAKAETLWGMIPPPLTNLGEAEAAAKETVTAFRGIAKHLAGISGQKVLVWVSTGFPDNAPRVPDPGLPPGARVPVMPASETPSTSFLQDLDDAVRVLGNANIVVESAESVYLGARVLAETGPVSSYVNTLQQVAERTGGRFYPGGNDFAATLVAAANDRASSYELGYYAGDVARPGLQPFEIKCRRPGVTLRYREGYYAGDEPAPKPPTVREAAQEILEGAVDAVAVPLTATATRVAGNAGSITLRLNVDAHSITLSQDGNVWRGGAAVLTRFASDVEDQLGDVPLDSPAFSFTREEYDQAMRNGIRLHFSMKVPADAVTLRVVVRDEGTGNAGTVTIPVGDLPE